MKPKGPYEIHALISRCHLHYKKNASFSVTLKIGNKASASTEFKQPLNDEINFNTELILKIDRGYFDGPGKLSIIVTMVTDDKEKKIIGSCISQFRQKGMQICKIGQCSCNDKGLEVMVEFEVVNIENQNNNLNNNKFLSPNNSEMKDLKKTLTITKDRELAKSSRIKPITATKSQAEKTEIKTNRQNKDKNSIDPLSPNLSSLTTKISSPQIKLQEESKDTTSQLRNKIMELERSLSNHEKNEIFYRKEVESLSNEIEILRRENECLIEILKFEEEKSSAAISYISFISKQITIEEKEKDQENTCAQIFESLRLDDYNDTSSAIKIHENMINERHLLEQNQKFPKQNLSKELNVDEKLMEEIEEYKRCIDELKQKVSDLESGEDYKNESISALEESVSQINQENSNLRNKISTLEESIENYQSEIKSLELIKKELEQKITSTENSLTELSLKYQQIEEKLKNETSSNSHLIKEKTQICNELTESNKKINQLKEYQKKYENLLKEYENMKNSIHKTPPESEIYARKSRLEDGEEIENLINEMNKTPQSNEDKNLLISSRQVFDKDPFLVRNKSESLLKDMEIDIDSEDPNTEETSKEISKEIHQKNRKISIPEHKKQPQKYNYEYDIDSLNYFNNFEEGHDGMELEGPEDNAFEVEPEVHG